MKFIPANIEWREERLYVLETLNDVKMEQKRLAEQAAADRATMLTTGTRDMNAAHEKIRALETTGRTLTIKNWLMGLLLSAGGIALFELLKALLHGWKP